ncbi:unnamed protein product, partial [Allacma fusca]
EYSGSDSSTERINSSRPIVSDLIVEVLSVGKLTNPNIYYQFVISTNKHGSSSNNGNGGSVGKFSWKINSFDCSSPCYGNAIPKYDCYRDNTIISAHYCTHLNYPVLKVKYCNTHCKHNWKLYSKSECILNTECGKGFKNLNYKCNLNYNNGSNIIVPDEKCSSEPKPEGKEPCVVPCDSPKWKYGAWGECDAICGDGWQTRTGICYFQNQNVEPYYCRNITHGNHDGDDKGILVVTSGKKLTLRRKCNERDCGEWKIDQWSPCSRTCGEGHSRAAYACYLHAQILPPDYCLTSPRPIVERKCDLPPCYQWSLGGYKCERCGVNVTRQVQCAIFNTGTVVDDRKCEGSEKPDNSVSCGDCLPEIAKLVSDDTGAIDGFESSSTQRDTTPVFGDWVALEYGECTNKGDTNYMRTRKVTCSTDHCDPATKPGTSSE